MAARLGNKPRILLICLTLLAATSLLHAQTTIGANGRSGALIGRIRSNLDDLRLTEDQQKQIDAILDQAGSDFRKIGPTLLDARPSERREQLDEFLGEVQRRIREVLKDDQAATFDARMKQMRAMRPDGAATAPQNDPAGFGPQRDRPGAILERVRHALAAVELSDEQKTQIEQVIADARQRVQQARRQADGDPQALREKLWPIFNETREKIAAVLTFEQQQKFRENMSAEPQRPAAATMMDSAVTGSDTRQERTPPSPSNEQIVEAFNDSGVKIGQTAPALSLRRVDGGTFTLEALRGRIVLLAFGSYSSPSFRQRAVSLERLRREFGNRISPVVIYTKETHANGQWEVERNKDEGVSVEQPADLEARIAQAKRARDALKLGMPVVVDDMDDAASRAYGGNTDAAVLIGRDGTILFRQKWFEPHAMRRAIDEALRMPATQPR